MIYLDNAATTKISPGVLHAMLPYYLDEYGNPGSLHSFGRKAKKAVDKARDQVARLFCTSPDCVIFTSGGTESNNMVFSGIKDHLKEIGKTHIIISEIEHDSVIHAAEKLAKDGFEVTRVLPKLGRYIDAKTLAEHIREDTGFVSVMYVNNETGAVSEIPQISKVCHERGILLHTDCVQAAGCVPLSVDYLGCDFASISSHKIHGPKGVGALYARNKELLSPMISGGEEQEFGLRGGTENVAGIVGFGKACVDTLEEYNPFTYSSLYATFMEGLLGDFSKHTLKEIGVEMNSWYGKILNIQVDGVDGQSLVLAMDSMGVCISAGSACRAHESEPSRTLLAIGRTPEQARSSVRISFSHLTTDEEAHEAGEIMAGCIKTLRGEESD